MLPVNSINQYAMGANGANPMQQALGNQSGINAANASQPAMLVALMAINGGNPGVDQIGLSPEAMQNSGPTNFKPPMGANGYGSPQVGSNQGMGTVPGMQPPLNQQIQDKQILKTMFKVMKLMMAVLQKMGANGNNLQGQQGQNPMQNIQGMNPQLGMMGGANANPAPNAMTQMPQMPMVNMTPPQGMAGGNMMPAQGMANQMPTPQGNQAAQANNNGILAQNGAISSPIQGNYSVNSEFGPRFDGFHTGIDLGAPMGTPIQAAMDGTVTKTGNDPDGYGNYVQIKHNDGTSSVYGHLNGFNVQEGQKVGAGSVLGQVGVTGRTTGPHLHFEYRDQNNNAVNPRNLMQF